jgi:hypothetical protein
MGRSPADRLITARPATLPRASPAERGGVAGHDADDRTWKLAARSGAEGHGASRVTLADVVSSVHRRCADGPVERPNGRTTAADESESNVVSTMPSTEVNQ